MNFLSDCDVPVTNTFISVGDTWGEMCTSCQTWIELYGDIGGEGQQQWQTSLNGKNTYLDINATMLCWPIYATCFSEL